MSEEILFTEFAPAERAAVSLVEADARFFADKELVSKLFNAVPDVFLVLNEQRQIVFANRAMLDLIGVKDSDTVNGLRPGEVLDCVHAFENPGGCGTSEFCKTCGAVLAILSSLRGKEAVQECRIVQKNGNALDLRVWTTPLTIGERTYSLFAVNDISHEKRRRVLERIFFHYIMNTAGGLQGVSELLQDATVDELDELKQMVYALAERLVDEIQTQRMLSAAETDDLVISPVQVHSVTVLRELADFYRNHEVARGRYIRLDPNTHDVSFVTDKTLLSRVIGNMLKNALEATKSGESVTLGCRANTDSVEIWVSNPTFMPRNVQLQVFQRSFSTKGSGRGLGTYSIKLLTERYLQGQVSFTTSEEAGTTFTARYPLAITMPEAEG
jgi:signal transduction histidine kinase